MPNATNPPNSMTPEQIVQHWSQSAKDAWRTTGYLFDKRDYASALFSAHLYLEKLLKAHIVKHTQAQAPFGHNLRVLANKAGLDLSAQQALLLDRVTEYNIAGRYDDWLFEFKKRCTRKFCRNEPKVIEGFGKWLLKML